jgi:acyl-CoA thioester hydrolase
VHEKRIEIRWRDLDAYGHVNQAVYLTYVEEVLDAWVGEVLGLEQGRIWDYVAARSAIDYRSELRLSDRAVVGRCALVRVGSSSVTARIELRASDGRLAAETEIVIVARDADSGRSRPLLDEERAAFERVARSRARPDEVGTRMPRTFEERSGEG